MQKNVASQKWIVFAFDATDGSPKTGDAGNITANLRIDGVQNAVDDENPTELERGLYEFDLVQAETNGDYLAIAPNSTTADIEVVGCPMALWTTSPNINALNIANGAVEGDLTYIHGSALGETAGGYLAGRFEDFFDIVTPTFNIGTALADFKATGFSTHDAAAVKTAIEAGGSSLAQILTDTGTTLDALIKDIPTVAEFEARSIVSADYTTVGDLGTVQSGDSFAIVNGAHGLVSIQDDVDAILIDSNELQTDWADGGRLDVILDAAGGAGDPWITALPGAYGAGSAGKIIGDNINAPIATVDTVVDAIKAKTDNLPADPADASVIAGALATIAAYIDTEVQAIKNKTDNIPASPAPASEYDTEMARITANVATEAKQDIIDTVVDSILEDTGTTLDALIDAIKAKTDNLPASPAAVGSAMTLAGDALDAAALKTDAVTEIVTAIFAKAGLTAGASATFADIIIALYAYVRGEIAKSSDDYAYKDDDDATVLFTNRIAASSRTPQ